MSDRPLIVLSFESLATAAVGCYGSSWNQTPAIDAIAAGGCVWDRWLATHDESTLLLRDWFASDANEWSASWRAKGSVALITDDVAVGRDAQCFDEITTLRSEIARKEDRPADDIESTQLAALIAAAIERDAAEEPWSVMWLHSRFLASRWDAPRELFPIEENELPSREPSEEVELLGGEELFAAEAEHVAAIFDSVVVPKLSLETSTNPDWITSWMRTYGCQVRLIDLMIEVLLHSIRVDDPQLILVGTSGFSLGQQGWIGHGCGPLRSPEIRLPMVLSDVGPIRMPQPEPSTTMVDILRDLADGRCPQVSPERWVSAPSDHTIRTESRRAQRAMTTGRWFFVRDDDASEHLFLKPDDVEDFNDVARLRLDVVDEFNLDVPPESNSR